MKDFDMKIKRLINIELTSNCPAHCAMCPRDQVKEKGFMPYETLKNIIDQIGNVNVWEITFSGRGEPTLHPDLPEMLSLCKKSPVTNALITTAVIMNKNNIEACGKNLDILRLSVSSFHKGTFEKIHRGLDYYKIWENINNLTDAMPQKIKVHFVGGETIYEHLKETIEFFHKKNIYSLYIFPLWNRGGNIAAKDSIKKRQDLMDRFHLLPIEDEFCIKDKCIFNTYMQSKTSINKNYCFHGDSSALITFKGDMLGCFQDFGSNNAIGNVNQNSLKELLEKRFYRLGNMDICKGCNSNLVTMI
ncbi:MAG: radical SAM protein [Oscillospiraceae bacterium]|jgi:MoaA/NifB/PqqE/SkfB family radical SAM enzyme|nr:radical SAM protein [Oscillospiraceae bacterium]